MPSAAAAALRTATSADAGTVTETGRSPQAVERRGALRPERLVSTRKRMRGASTTLPFRTADSIMLVAIAIYAMNLAVPGGALQTKLIDILPTLTAGAVLVWMFKQLRVYRFGIRESLFGHSLRILAALAVAAIAASIVVKLTPTSLSAAEILLLTTGLGLAGLVASHLIWRGLIATWRAQGRLTPNIVIVGANENALRLIQSAAQDKGVSIIGIFDDRLGRAPKSIEGVPVLGNLNDLIGHRVLPYVDQIVVAVNSSAQDRVRDILGRLSILPNEVTVLLDGEEGAERSAALSRIADSTLATVSGAQADERKGMMKRFQDLAIGSIALLVAAPIMMIIALAIKLDSPGPIFFRQRRHGFNNEAISVWKFRTMHHSRTDHNAHRQTQADDDRITPVGRFLRPTSLDELPQIFNVLKGEMSLVGPRPHAIGMKTGDVESARLIAEYAHRHRIKPGMTGWAAIHGSRGPVDTPEAVRRRVNLDVQYIQRQSFWLDIWILLVTIPCLLGDRDNVR